MCGICVCVCLSVSVCVCVCIEPGVPTVSSDEANPG